MASFSNALHPAYERFNAYWTWELVFVQAWELKLVVNPARLGALALGALIILLLYRRITTLGKLTLVVWVGVLGLIVWILIEGAIRFDPHRAFDFSGSAAQLPNNFATNLGAAMILAMYSY